MKKKYWQNFGELNQTEAYQEKSNKEFPEELLPLEDLVFKGISDVKAPRRDFLKYLGFSTAAATLAASCDLPVRKAVPYLNKPDNLIAGVANYYASTYVNEGDVIPVIVKQIDGRPIKIEGNESSSITNGGTSAQAQASVLDLYDNTRLRYPMQNDGKEFKEVSSFAAFDKLIADKMSTVATKPVVILSSTINSPSTLQIIAEFLAKQPAGSRLVQYDAVSYSGMLLANEACYNKKVIPSYHFDNAKVIVSIGADFLGTWLSPVEFATQYAKNRKVTDEKTEMSHHIQFEGTLSLTGSNADDRYMHKPSEKAAIALALLAKVGGTATVSLIKDAELSKSIDAAAMLLNAHKGASLVVCGSNDMHLQIIVNAINEAIGANGKTINWGVTSNYRQGIDADVIKLVDDMNAGTIGAILINATNPVYTYYDSQKFAGALKKVPVSISFNATMNETTELCKFSIPAPHWLESWGDAEAKSGFISFMQPTVNPLFKTRYFQTSLLKWSGSVVADYDTYFKLYWTTKLVDVDTYNNTLQAGVIKEPVILPVTVAFNNTKLAEAILKVNSVKSGDYEVVIYQKISVGTGNQANNPWLQELPDPISKVTWDNYALVSPVFAKAILGIDVAANQREGDRYEVTPEKPTIKIKANNKEIELPVLIIPGIHPNVVAVAVGYGRQSADKTKTAENIGRSANEAGSNVYPLVSYDGTGFRYSTAATITKTENVYALGQTQVHGSSESRPVIFETSLKAFKANPKAVLAEPRDERQALLPYGGTDFRKDATIYPDLLQENPGIKWGMNIDLTTCTGCSACVVACTAENNVAVVGKIQVVRAHEMHWLRIDRYFTGDKNNPDVVFQPMMCQHCDNAPCENVCPVAATNHSSEGLNQMTYNRCIGTRYCANNCPYKVRRFNWLDYNGADSFADNQQPLVGVDMNESVMQMNDDLTRMVLNPDVTVRSRGVIEKCSFCVQRLQENKLIAKKAEDPSLIRNIKTACMQACPTKAISFGNVNDPECEVAKSRKDDNRTFYVLEQLHVLPNVSYMAKVKNTDRHVTNEKEEEGEHKEIKSVKEEKVHA